MTGNLAAFMSAQWTSTTLLSGQKAVVDPVTRVHGLITTHGHQILVDECDLTLVQGYYWSAHQCKRTMYATSHGPRVEGRRAYLRLHRVLLQPPRHLLVDHINGNGLDNRRENLRLATFAQNARNHRLFKNNSTGFRGVHLQKQSGRFVAYIGNPPKYLGIYTDALTAAKAYNDAAVDMFGEFAQLNEVD